MSINIKKKNEINIMSTKEPLANRIKQFGDEANLSSKEAAQFLNIHYSTLAHWRRNKKISQPPYTRVGRLFIVYRLGDLKEYMKPSEDKNGK